MTGFFHSNFRFVNHGYWAHLLTGVDPALRVRGTKLELLISRTDANISGQYPVNNYSSFYGWPLECHSCGFLTCLSDLANPACLKCERSLFPSAINLERIFIDSKSATESFSLTRTASDLLGLSLEGVEFFARTQARFSLYAFLSGFGFFQKSAQFAPFYNGPMA